jgi:hypothetical protein
LTPPLKLFAVITIKHIRATVLNVGLIAGWIYAPFLGGDPTVITFFALLALADSLDVGAGEAPDESLAKCEARIAASGAPNSGEG